jgi:hypothetical protein
VGSNSSVTDGTVSMLSRSTAVCYSRSVPGPTDWNQLLKTVNICFISVSINVLLKQFFFSVFKIMNCLVYLINYNIVSAINPRRSVPLLTYNAFSLTL